VAQAADLAKTRQAEEDRLDDQRYAARQRARPHVNVGRIGHQRMPMMAAVAALALSGFKK